MAASFIRSGFAEHMMVTKLLPVIGGKNDDGVVIQLLFDQCHDQPADLVIQMGNAGIVADLCLAYQFRIRRASF